MKRKGIVDSLAGRAPHAHVDPAGFLFSVAARSQVHWPAGRAPVIHNQTSVSFALVMFQTWRRVAGAVDSQRARTSVLGGCLGRGKEEGGQDLRQEQRAPATVFSVFAFSQLHLRADCLPQEHFACWAQTQAWPERPQQVVGTVIVGAGGVSLL